MTLRTLLIAYLVGGLTFLPLLVAAVAATAWYLLPSADNVEQASGSSDGSGNTSPAEDEKQKRQEERKWQESIEDTAASATFAVLRKYDLQAAITALNARNNAGTTANSNGIPDSSASKELNASVANESVYQSMYRSVFTGNRNASTTSLLHDQDADLDPGTRRKSVPANVSYIVLRHGHLMLYDSPAQVEVKHVISLAHHKVSLQAAKVGDDSSETDILEADLFTRRTAIVLTPVDLPNGVMQRSNGQKAAKPFYLFCATNIDKEDFYRALLYTRAHPPQPRPLDSDALIKLQSALHSSSLTPETRALNALLGRVFLGIHQTDRLVELVRTKIERKLGRIQKPSFIPVVQIRSLDLGDGAPVFSNLKLRDLNISGDTTVSVDMRYNGGLSITLLAVAKLDLGTRFKTRTVDLVLKTSIHRIQGTMLLHIKPAPSNRLWYCFETMPELEVRVEPVVSERKITYGFVLRAIEEKLRTAFSEGLVKPNWDDTPMPLQDTRGSHARGGVWLDEGQEDHVQLASDAVKTLADRNEKTNSMPALIHRDTSHSTGLASSSEVNLAKVRHASTVPVDSRDSNHRPVPPASTSLELGDSPARTSLPPKPLRSPSISSISPSVAVTGQSVEPVRSDDASLRPTSSQRKPWLSRGTSASLPPHRDALEGLRDLRARVEQAATKSAPTATEENGASRRHSEQDDHQIDASDSRSTHSRQQSDASETKVSGTPRSFSPRSAGSELSAATSAESSVKSQQLQQKKANILAAAGAATNAARNWGWSTYQKNKGALQRGSMRPDQFAIPNEPIGRGQPLPPPGVPLPGPNKGILGGIAGMRRKPIPSLPSRPRQASESSEASKQTVLEQNKESTNDLLDLSNEDEFIWHENSGQNGIAAHDGQQEELSTGIDAVQEEKSTIGEAPSDTSDGSALPGTDENVARASESQEIAPHTKDRASSRPPPLPARRHHESNEKINHSSSLSSTESGVNKSGADTPENDSQDEVSAATALRVPEYAARAIAAENSTPGEAHGSADDREHIDVISGIEAEVLPNHGLADIDQDPHNEIIDDDDLSRLQLKRSDTRERFARGEDVSEEDFEHRETAAEASAAHGGESISRGDLAERIRAQVQMHTTDGVQR